MHVVNIGRETCEIQYDLAHILLRCCEVRQKVYIQRAHSLITYYIPFQCEFLTLCAAAVAPLSQCHAPMYLEPLAWSRRWESRHPTVDQIQPLLLPLLQPLLQQRAAGHGPKQQIVRKTIVICLNDRTTL